MSPWRDWLKGGSGRGWPEPRESVDIFMAHLSHTAITRNCSFSGGTARTTSEARRGFAKRQLVPKPQSRLRQLREEIRNLKGIAARRAVERASGAAPGSPARRLSRGGESCGRK